MPRHLLRILLFCSSSGRVSHTTRPNKLSCSSIFPSPASTFVHCAKCGLPLMRAVADELMERAVPGCRCVAVLRHEDESTSRPCASVRLLLWCTVLYRAECVCGSATSEAGGLKCFSGSALMEHPVPEMRMNAGPNLHPSLRAGLLQTRSDPALLFLNIYICVCVCVAILAARSCTHGAFRAAG